MDLASLSNEVRHEELPQLVQGWANEDFFKLLEMYKNKCTLQTMVVHFKSTRGKISGLLHRARANGLVEQAHRGQIAQPKSVAKEVKPACEKVDPASVKVAKLVQRLAKQKSKRRVRLRLIESEHAVTFADLEPHHCRWPIGDPRNSDFRFCGCRRVIGKPYCEGHVVMAGRMYDKDPVRRMIVRPSYRR